MLSVKLHEEQASACDCVLSVTLTFGIFLVDASAFSASSAQVHTLSYTRKGASKCCPCKCLIKGNAVISHIDND